ncbi:MAG: hypothetical protein WAM60_10395 [Candidatus Promineifilaceae bacterium]
MISKPRRFESEFSFLAGKQALFAFVVLILSTLGCVLNEFVDSPTVTPSPVESTDYLTYTAPAYNVTLSAGQTVPGTRLQYISRSDSVYNVTIDGQPLNRQGGDSLPWQGVVAPGVFAKYNLRITPSFGVDGLIAAGPVELIVLNPLPSEIPNLPVTTADAYYYANIVVAESIALGDAVPGTTLVYSGQTNQGAAFSGTTQYPYRALGDSLIWLGQLRDNVYIRQNLRVITFSDELLRLGGTAEIWIIPRR